MLEGISIYIWAYLYKYIYIYIFEYIYIYTYLNIYVYIYRYIYIYIYTYVASPYLGCTPGHANLFAEVQVLISALVSVASLPGGASASWLFAEISEELAQRRELPGAGWGPGGRGFRRR